MDDPEDDPDLGDDRDDYSEAFEDIDAFLIARTLERRPLDAFVFVVNRVRFLTHELAVAMHLSGVFGVDEEVVREVVLRLVKLTIDGLLDAVGRRLVCAPQLRAGLTEVWRYDRFLNRARERGRWEFVELTAEVEPVAEGLRERVVRFAGVAKAISKLARDVRTIAGIREDDVDRLLDRIEGPAQSSTG